jgi:hypothetical protein
MGTSADYLPPYTLTPFIEFILIAIRDALCEASTTDQVTDQVAALLRAIRSDDRSATDLMRSLGLSHRPHSEGIILTRYSTAVGSSGHNRRRRIARFSATV